MLKFSKLNSNELKVVGVTLLVAATGIASYFAARTVIERNQTPQWVVNKFLSNIEAKNAVQAAKYVIDQRFPTTQALVAFYNSDFQFDAIKSFKVLNEKDVSKNSAEVGYTIVFVNPKTPPQNSTFKLVKRNKQWKIFIHGYNN